MYLQICMIPLLKYYVIAGVPNEQLFLDVGLICNCYRYDQLIFTQQLYILL